MGIEAVRQRLRLAVATGLAMGVGGCTSVVPDDDSVGSTAGDGSTSNGGTGGSSATSATAMVTTASTTTTTSTTEPESDATDERDFRFDTPPGPTYPGTCHALRGTPDCAEPDPTYESVGVVCLEPEESGFCDAFDEDDVLEAAGGCGTEVGRCQCPVEIACALPTNDDECCYEVLFTFCCPGRPFVVDGRARVPTSVPREDWSATIQPDCCALDQSARTALAAAWATEAGFEAASVASFSRFVLQLLSLGAPAGLVADAQQALAEEIQHARILYGLAGAYGGTRLGPGPLSIDGALELSSTPVDIAVALAAEGCIGETVSAFQLQLAAARAKDPTLRAALTTMAEEEVRHAELAWRTLAWLLPQGDEELRTRVCEVFRNAADHVPGGASEADHLDADVLHDHGRFAPAELRALASRALTALVAPAADVLLQSFTTTADRWGTVAFLQR